MESDPILNFYHTIQKKLHQAFQQKKELFVAATWVAEALENQGWIYTSGTGHSHLLAEEIFFRAGGFARVRPIFDEGLMLHLSASQSSLLERESGYGLKAMIDFPIEERDVFVISSNSGRNTASIEMAQFAKEKGAKVIVLTNFKHSKSVESRHPSGLMLFEIADLFLDNFGEIGDASIELSGLQSKVGATSTILGAAMLQAIMVQAAAILTKKGILPEIFSSSNTEEGERYNQGLLEKYKPEVKGL